MKISTLLVGITMLTALAMPLRGQTIDNCMFEQRTIPGSTVNFWDWTIETHFTVFRSQNNAEQIPSPFVQVSPVGAPNSQYLVSNQDFQPEDGWELYFKAFGTALDPVNIPAFGMYNRYNGRLRLLMFAGSATQTYQLASIIWKQTYNNGAPVESSILEHINTHMNALDNFEKKLTLTSLNAYNNPGVGNGNGIWLVAEIVAAYDPCTYMNPTYLEFKPLLTTTSDVALEVTGTIETTPVVSSNGELSSGMNDFFKLTTGALNSGTSIMNKGMATYKSVDEFDNQLLTLLNAIGIGIPNISPVNIGKAFSTFGAISAGITILDFLVTGGSTVAKPTVTSYSSAVSLNIGGTITTTDPYSPIVMGIPGAEHNANFPYSIPVYDNVLGVMNLLETPLLARKWDYDDSFLGGVTVALQPIGDIKYVINPHAGLAAPTELKGAFYLEGEVDPVYQSGLIKVY